MGCRVKHTKRAIPDLPPVLGRPEVWGGGEGTKIEDTPENRRRADRGGEFLPPRMATDAAPAQDPPAAVLQR